jgi:type III pantothenate kinase
MAGTLAVDVSNLQTGLALWLPDREPHHWKVASMPARTADEYRVIFAELLAAEGLSTADVSACVLGCVVPELAGTFVSVLKSLFGSAPLVVGPGVRAGLDIRGDDPREVGADRIANAVAARAKYGVPVVVLDFGTALTLDVIGPAGDYLGAVIAPGMEVAAEGLRRRAARLGPIELEAPPRAIATNTTEGLQAGLVFGYVGMAEGLVQRVRAEVGPAPVVATGDGPWLSALLRLTEIVDAYDPLLTLRGLRLILEHHRRR